jgi:hypothetical protein
LDEVVLVIAVVIDRDHGPEVVVAFGGVRAHNMLSRHFVWYV